MSLNFGLELSKEFHQRSSRVAFKEVPLFRALHESFSALTGNFLIEELHGCKSRVKFRSNVPWTKPAEGDCELSDLCVIWYKTKPAKQLRITFLQAKRSDYFHNVRSGWPHTVSEDFIGNSTQWDLLSNRPDIQRVGKFSPPKRLLADAALRSVGSFGIFYRPTASPVELFYAAADVITCPSPSANRSKSWLALNAAVSRRIVNGYSEGVWACSIQTFGEMLYEGIIGTPIHDEAVLTPDYSARRRVVRSWLRTFVSSSAGNNSGDIVRDLIENFDIAGDDRHSSSPAKKIFIINGNEPNTKA